MLQTLSGIKRDIHNNKKVNPSKKKKKKTPGIINMYASNIRVSNYPKQNLSNSRVEIDKSFLIFTILKSIVFLYINNKKL